MAIPVLKLIMTKVEYIYFCPVMKKANMLRHIIPLIPSSGKMAQPILCKKTLIKRNRFLSEVIFNIEFIPNVQIYL